MTGESRERAVQSLRVGAAVQALPLVTGYGVNLLATPYVVMQLGLHDFGIWSITGAIAQLAALFDLGITRATIRYVALFHARGEADKGRQVLGVMIAGLSILICVLYLLAFLTSGLLNRILYTGDPALARLLAMSAVTMLGFGLLGRGLAAAATGKGRYVPANIGLAALAVSQVGGGVAALIMSPTLRNFALGSAIGAAVGFIAIVTSLLVDEGWIEIGWPKIDLVKEIAVYGLKGQVLGGADVIFLQSGKIIAGVILGPSAAGTYELGSRLVQGAQSFGATASVALGTHLTRAYAIGGLAEILVQYRYLTRRNASVAIFFPLLLCATSFTAIPLWLGDQHYRVVAVVAALSPSIAINVSTAVCTTTLFAIGRPGLVAAAAAISAAMATLLAIVLSEEFGYTGIVLAFAIWIAIGNLLTVWFLQSRIGIPMKEYLDAVKGPFIVGICAAIIVLPIGFVTDPQTRSEALLPFLYSLLIFCAIYAIFGWYFDYLPRVERLAKMFGAIRKRVDTDSAQTGTEMAKTSDVE